MVPRHQTNVHANKQALVMKRCTSLKHGTCRKQGQQIVHADPPGQTWMLCIKCCGSIHVSMHAGQLLLRPIFTCNSPPGAAGTKMAGDRWLQHVGAAQDVPVSMNAGNAAAAACLCPPTSWTVPGAESFAHPAAIDSIEGSIRHRRHV